MVAFPDVVIHRGCRLYKVIIDSSALPPGMVIGEDAEEDAAASIVVKVGHRQYQVDAWEGLQQQYPELFAALLTERPRDSPPLVLSLAF